MRMSMRVAAWTGGMLMVLAACKVDDDPPPPHLTAGSAAPTAALGDAGPWARSAMFAVTMDRWQHKPLASDERRVALFVVPGDASVEVDGQPARRTNGIIELIGKKGDRRTVRISKGAKRTAEKTVIIGEADASPVFLDLNAPPPPGARKAAKEEEWEPIMFKWSKRSAGSAKQ